MVPHRQPQAAIDRSRAGSTFRNDMLWLLLPGFALLGLYQFGRLLPGAVLLAFWTASAMLIALGHFLRLRIRRRAWLQAYVAPASRLQHWLRGGALALFLRAALAALLAATLMVGTLRLAASDELLLLLASLPLLAALRWVAEYSLASHVASSYRPEAVWRLTLALTFVILCAALLASAWWRAGPDFTAVTLEQAAWHMALQEQARNATLEQVLGLAGAIEGVRWWLAQNALPQFQWPLLELLGWLLLLLESVLFVWSWLHCCVGVMLMRTLWEPSGVAPDIHAPP